MSKRTKVIVGTLSVLVIVGISTFFFLRYQLQKSFPQVSGTIRLAGLEKPVDIFRDEFGVPHIMATSEHDLLFGLGFVHAQDRLWQMDVTRRAGQGRLSEIFGEKTVPFDKMFRIIGIRRISENVEESISRESHQRLQWYADGVNALIAAQKGKYPIEFDVLGYEPEPWAPVHSIMIGRLMAWELTFSWWTELTFGALAHRVGLQKTLELLPSYPGTVSPTVPSQALERFADMSRECLQTARGYIEFWGAMPGGSNAWVIAPTRSASGKVVLANDTHLQLQVPSKWYEVQLHTPGSNVSGMSIPGVPGIVVGHNQYIVWGVTNAMVDDADFYIERLDSTTNTRYLYEGRWLPIAQTDEEIRVKGDSAVTVTIRSTHHGPIVTDIRTFLKKGDYPFVASMRWTGTEISDQIEAFHKMNKARNWKEFLSGVREFTGPGQNFVYGDVDGNIGYWCGVKLPIRGSYNSSLPVPGWQRAAEWKGYVPFERLPHLVNPREGYIATANNKIVDDRYPYYISNLWEPPSRILRLRESLSKNELFSVEDFGRLQNDTFSHMARELTPYILAALRDNTADIPEQESVIEYFSNWNFSLAEEDITTTIFQEFFVKLLENMFRDEMGDDILHDFLILATIPLRATTKLIVEGTSSWFDDVATAQVETRDAIIRKSMRDAVLALQASRGNEMKTWRWGDLHTVTLKHPLGLIKPLDKLFNIGPFPYKGGSTALISGEYSFNNPFEVTVGASFRQIVDLANPGKALRVLPSGQSGQVLHPHFKDQTHLWLNGALRTVRADTLFRKETQWDHLTLEPAQ